MAKEILGENTARRIPALLLWTGNERGYLPLRAINDH